MALQNIKADKGAGEGVDLYKKYLLSQGQDGEDEFKRLEEFAEKELLKDEVRPGYILCDRDMQLVTGVMDLAIALGGKNEAVSMALLPMRHTGRSVWEIFEEVFSDTEMSTIRRYVQQLINEMIKQETENHKPDYDRKKLVKAIRKGFRRVYGFDSKKLNFGGRASMHSGGFYQSFPLLGIAGWRKTDERIRDYGLYEELNNDMDVLNIGCNMGFFDMTIANRVRSVTSIEYNIEASRLSRKIARRIGVYNVRFVGEDFKKWQEQDTNRYDLIMCCSVFSFLHLHPTDFANMIDRLTKEGGKFMFEAGRFEEEPANGMVVRELKNKGFYVAKKGTTKDEGEEGECLRTWIMLKR